MSNFQPLNNDMAFVFLSIDWHIVRVGLVLLGMGVFTVVFETVIMLLFRFDSFGKSLVDSIMANVGSLLFGILLFLVFNKTEFDVSQLTELFAFYCITSIFEGWLIRLLRVTTSSGSAWRRSALLMTS